MITMRRWIKRRLRRIGVDVKRLHVASDPGLQLQQSIKYLGIDLVLDVGANRGQFVQQLRSNGYRGRVVSFEPLSQVHNVLAETAKHDSFWLVHDRVALGAVDGTTEINIAGNLASSSVLEMLDLHRDSAPGTSYIGKEVVPLRRLDSVAFAYVDANARTLLKVDVQGYQKQVLEGAAGIIQNVQAIYCELSVTPLYEDEQHWQETVNTLLRQGFVLWSLFPGFVNPYDGRTLQFDGLFIKDER